MGRVNRLTLFFYDVNTTPNNSQDNLQSPVEVSPSTHVELTKNGQSVAKKTINNNQPEKPLYTTPDKQTQIQAGADDKGFYADRFNGDNDPKSYTMGPGYNWQAPKDNQSTKDGKPTSSLPQTGAQITVWTTVIGTIIIISTLIFNKRRGVK